MSIRLQIQIWVRCGNILEKKSFSAIFADEGQQKMLPFLLMLFTNGFNGIFKVLSAASIFMVIYEIVDKIYDVWLMSVGISVVVIAGCICRRYGRYKGQQG